MKPIACAVAGAILLLAPVSAPTSAVAGVAAPSLNEAVKETGNPAIQEVRHRRRAMRYERRMRKERRAIRRCIRRGHCPIVYVYVPVYYSVPIWFYYGHHY